MHVPEEFGAGGPLAARVSPDAKIHLTVPLTVDEADRLATQAGRRGSRLAELARELLLSTIDAEGRTSVRPTPSEDDGAVGEALDVKRSDDPGIRVSVDLGRADTRALIAAAEARGLTLLGAARELLAEALAPYREAGEAAAARARRR